MRNLVTAFLLFFAIAGNGQTTDSLNLNYRSLEYFVTGRDTNSITCVKGNWGELNYSKYDSTYIFAHIIYPNLPLIFNRDSLSNKTREVMIIENIQKSYVWRDTKSLWMLPLSYRSDEMRREENASSIGWMMINDEKIRYDSK